MNIRVLDITLVYLRDFLCVLRGKTLFSHKEHKTI